jgi:hypothetical protein
LNVSIDCLEDLSVGKEVNVKMDLKDGGYWIYVDKHRGQWQAFLNIPNLT